MAHFHISGNRFYYIVQWHKTGRPPTFHIHRGEAEDEQLAGIRQDNAR
ncbi:hypothetical protein [Nonomuraea sp. NPDC049141]